MKHSGEQHWSSGPLTEPGLIHHFALLCVRRAAAAVVSVRAWPPAALQCWLPSVRLQRGQLGRLHAAVLTWLQLVLP